MPRERLRRDADVKSRYPLYELARRPDRSDRRCPSATAPSIGCVPSVCSPLGLSSALVGSRSEWADQRPIDRRASWQRREALLRKIGTDGPRAPGRMHPAQLDHSCLDDNGRLVGTGLGSRALVGQARHPVLVIAAQPAVHRLTSHPIATGDVAHARPVEDIDHRPIQPGGNGTECFSP